MLVSIVMTVYNGERYLKESVSAALSQTYTDIELIVINNGSTDATPALLNHIKDERVTVIHLKQNRGAAQALNIGIRQARGSWIAINDADDIFFPHKIEKQVKYLREHPELVGVGTLVDYISEIPRCFRYIDTLVSRRAIRKQAFYICPVIHSSLMYARDSFWKAGGYDPGFEIAYDYDLCLRLLEIGPIEKVPQALVYYRIEPGSLSQADLAKTSIESQMASSRGISRQVERSRQHQPAVVITGPPEACRNYCSNIAPLCGLHVDGVIDRQWRAKIDQAIDQVNQGKIDAIIVLKGYRRKRILRYLLSKGLSLNNNVFSIYNVLM